MEGPKRGNKLGTAVNPEYLKSFSEEQGLWYETPETVRAELRRGKRNALLLAWVRREMEVTLNEAERHCVELHFFQGLSYRQMGEAAGMHASSAFRTVQRGIRTLRDAAAREGGAEAILRKLGASGGIPRQGA